MAHTVQSCRRARQQYITQPKPSFEEIISARFLRVGTTAYLR